MSACPESIARAYRVCERLAASHYENFPVASRLLPSAMRPHVAAVYAFARAADDVADEGEGTAWERQARLRIWQERLHTAVAAVSRPAVTAPSSSAADEQIVLALGHTIRTLGLPLTLFDDLLSAFGQDTMTTRYASWSDLLDYCRRSANPVGRLVLRIAGYRDGTLDQSSDALCTALQLTNFWQDLGRDWANGRLYVPRDVLARHGADEADAARGRLTRAWGDALRECIDVTRGRFRDGRLVCEGVRGRLRYELRLTWLGGRRMLAAIERDPESLIGRRPVLGAADLPVLLWQAVRWRGTIG